MDIKKSYPNSSLTADSLTIGYLANKPVLENLNFKVTAPGLIRLDSPNGTGKSTLIEAASGYLKPLAGKLSINGIDVRELELRLIRKVCRERPALHPYLSLNDHLAIAADLGEVERSEPLSRAKNYGLDEWARTRTTELSTGTAKKLWFIMCTTGKFSMVFLDEPFNGLDRESVDLMCGEINAWKTKKLVVLASHTIPAALELDETLVLHEL